MNLNNYALVCSMRIVHVWQIQKYNRPLVISYVCSEIDEKETVILTA